MRSNRLTRTVRVLALCAAGLLAASGAALAQTSAPAASTAAAKNPAHGFRGCLLRFLSV